MSCWISSSICRYLRQQQQHQTQTETNRNISIFIFQLAMKTKIKPDFNCWMSSTVLKIKGGKKNKKKPKTKDQSLKFNVKSFWMKKEIESNGVWNSMCVSYSIIQLTYVFIFCIQTLNILKSYEMKMKRKNPYK